MTSLQLYKVPFVIDQSPLYPCMTLCIFSRKFFFEETWQWQDGVSSLIDGSSFSSKEASCSTTRIHWLNLPILKVVPQNKWQNCAYGISPKMMTNNFSVCSITYLCTESAEKCIPKMAQSECEVFVEEISEKFAHPAKISPIDVTNKEGERRDATSSSAMVNQSTCYGKKRNRPTYR